MVTVGPPLVCLLLSYASAHCAGQASQPASVWNNEPARISRCWRA